MCLSPPYLILRKIFKTYDLGSDLDRKVLILLGAVLQIIPNMGFSCGLRRKMMVGFRCCPLFLLYAGCQGFLCQLSYGFLQSNSEKWLPMSLFNFPSPSPGLLGFQRTVANLAFLSESHISRSSRSEVAFEAGSQTSNF
jgi:hypothetical protein